VKTFRDSDGTWEEYDVMQIADISKWRATHNRKENRQYMLDFYNKLRAQLPTVHPNSAHIAIGEFEKLDGFDVHVITQNVDDLHERGGTTKIIHLYGELNKVRCTLTEEIYDHTGDLNVGDKSPNNAQLRPHIVWFGEAVPMMMPAVEMLSDVDAVVVCGTSLLVAPANMIFDILPKHVKKFYVNMEIPSKETKEALGITCFEEAVTTGIPKVIKILTDE